MGILLEGHLLSEDPVVIELSMEEEVGVELKCWDQSSTSDIENGPKISENWGPSEKDEYAVDSKSKVVSVDEGGSKVVPVCGAGGSKVGAESGGASKDDPGSDQSDEDSVEREEGDEIYVVEWIDDKPFSTSLIYISSNVICGTSK